ncbi:MAG: sporulation protein YqfC [Clostridiaceae bacterium]|jgi:sporulation protein YqfC|nr:sporulation protein YqfC [Clostridiaceae bacterium]
MKRVKKEPDKRGKSDRSILSIGEKLAKLFELPPDLFGNRPKVTAVGRGEVLIENFKGIMDFEEGMVRINTNNGVIKITGSGITIREITSEAIIIGGKISNIDYDA